MFPTKPDRHTYIHSYIYTYRQTYWWTDISVYRVASLLKTLMIKDMPDDMHGYIIHEDIDWVE